MDISERKDFYEKLYFHELDIRDKLDQRLKLSMTVFAIIGAMALYLFDDSRRDKIQDVSCIFVVLYFSACISFLASIIFFIKSWYGYTYKMLPDAVTLENYYQDTFNHYMDIDERNAQNWTNESFKEYLLITFRDYVAANTVNNDKKAYNLHLSNSAILIAFFLYLISYYPYYSIL
ncbi:hypothetical protein [Paraglaciecola chathamensis]|uniref:hypothetical protein n=1 Tax=Paraglaciecola chathamensis TaxID=368405 RepID=UPI002711543C|nr:hypothetical protein [Paraglaciecola chathamensis]MDO6561212.1 hypothetical protein [Paraglaciecola chathamensis]